MDFRLAAMGGRAGGGWKGGWAGGWVVGTHPMSPSRSRRSSAASSSPAMWNDATEPSEGRGGVQIGFPDFPRCETRLQRESEVNVATPMGTTSSTASSSGAPGGSAAPNGTSLEAALAQIEEEQLQKVRPRPSMPPRRRGKETKNADTAFAMRRSLLPIPPFKLT